jgi:AcrR family transcriptional regulator
MVTPPVRAPRRREALSRAGIISAAIEILDGGGEQELTARAVTRRLATGRGAIYHHVSGMGDLLAAAAEAVVAAAIAPVGDDSSPRTSLYEFAGGLFDAIAEHPWAGAQLARDPFQAAVLMIWKRIGVSLQQLGLSGPARSDAGAALVSYVFGAAAQYAAGSARALDDNDRQRFLDELATRWTDQDGDDVVREASADLRDHDDREQFLAGVEIFLRGIAGA